RGVLDWRRKLRPVDAAVDDGEGAAMQLVEGPLAITRSGGELGDGAFDLGEALPVGIANDGHHESLVGADGDADVVVVLLDDLVPLDLRVQEGELLQGTDHRAGEERHEAELQSVLLDEISLPALADLEDAAEVDLVEGGEAGRGLLSFDESAGDGLPPLGHSPA